MASSHVSCSSSDVTTSSKKESKPQLYLTLTHKVLSQASMISWCLWHPGKKNHWETYESQSPVLEITEGRRENYDNVAFTWSKYYSCNNSPITLVKLRSKHYYLHPEACQRWYALEFILSKTELFSSSLKINTELQSKPVAVVRIDSGTCWVSSHLTTINISCTEVIGSYIRSEMYCVFSAEWTNCLEFASCPSFGLSLKRSNPCFPFWW